MSSRQCPRCSAPFELQTLCGECSSMDSVYKSKTLYGCKNRHWWVVHLTKKGGTTTEVTKVLDDGLPEYARMSVLFDIDFLKKNDVQYEFNWEPA